MIGTQSIENDVARIENDLQHVRAEEQARKRELKSEFAAKLGEPQWLLAGFAGGALLGYLITPAPAAKEQSDSRETEDDIEARPAVHHHEGFWHKIMDHALVVLRTYLTALVAHHAIDKVEDEHDHRAHDPATQDAGGTP